MQTVADEIKRLERQLAKATADSRKRSEARASLSPGTSRARITTANARWERAAEERDRIHAALDAARASAEPPTQCRKCGPSCTCDIAWNE